MHVEYITRSDAGLVLPNRYSPDRASTTGWVAHHSATEGPKSIQQSIAQWQSIQRDHLSRIIYDKNGNPVLDANGEPLKWADIAYCVGIGYRCILTGRGLAVKGGGTGQPWDNYTVSVCVLGNYHDEELTDDFRVPLVECLKHIRVAYGNDITTNGDRDFNSTQCPGDNFYPYLGEIWAESAPSIPTPQPPEEEEDMYFQMISEGGNVFLFGPNGQVHLGGLGTVHGKLNESNIAPVRAMDVPDEELTDFANRWKEGMK